MGCYSLLQGIFLTQGSNPGLLSCRQILYHLSYQGGPFVKCTYEDTSGRSFLTLGRAPQGVMGREVLLQSWRGKWEIQGRAADHTPDHPWKIPRGASNPSVQITFKKDRRPGQRSRASETLFMHRKRHSGASGYRTRLLAEARVSKRAFDFSSFNCCPGRISSCTFTTRD